MELESTLAPDEAENLQKAIQTAELLLSDLRQLAKSKNGLLGLMALDLIHGPAGDLQKRLAVIEASTTKE